MVRRFSTEIVSVHAKDERGKDDTNWRRCENTKFIAIRVFTDRVPGGPQPLTKRLVVDDSLERG